MKIRMLAGILAAVLLFSLAHIAFASTSPVIEELYKEKRVSEFG